MVADRRARVEEMLDGEGVEDAVLWDGLDSALVGIGSQWPQAPVAVYDRRRIIEAFVAQGMTQEDAEEYASFNVLGAHVGPGTPIHLDLLEDD